MLLHDENGKHYIVSAHRMSRADDWDSFTVLNVFTDSARAQRAFEHLNDGSAIDGNAQR